MGGGRAQGELAPAGVTYCGRAGRLASEGCLPRPEGGSRATGRAPEHRRHAPPKAERAPLITPLPSQPRRWWRRCSTAQCLWRRRWARSCSGTRRACVAPRITTACAAQSSPSTTCGTASGRCGAPAELRLLLPRCAESDNVAVRTFGLQINVSSGEYLTPYQVPSRRFGAREREGLGAGTSGDLLSRDGQCDGSRWARVRPWAPDLLGA